MAFDVLDRDGSGHIDLADIALAYDVSQHPDYKAGKKTKDAVLMEFLSGFDVGGTNDGTVTREEFANYYTQISSSIERDDYFELMIRNAWCTFFLYVCSMI
jgi:Ca2+-binding EF-hand superfamily protein